MEDKLGCASVKLHVWLGFLKILSDLINFGLWLTRPCLGPLVTILWKLGDNPLEGV